MKVSLNWMKYYGGQGLDAPIDKIVNRIGEQLGEVEGVESLAERYRGAVVAKVVSCEKHPNADKLHVCLIDDNRATKDVKRDKEGLVEVVCGAPNVKAGMTVVWLPPGAVVPSTWDEERFTLEARELRGVVSNGMLASAKELGISEDHSGIAEVEDDVKLGTTLIEALKLDDYVIDIENKMFTHRPDCFGQLGVAREVTGISGKSFNSPYWYIDEPLPIKSTGDKLALKVENKIPELAPRFMAIAVCGVEVKPSTLWLQSFLSRVGINPINNLVDLTNYYMMLTGQPLHAFDYDKVAALSKSDGATLTVRKAKAGEQIELIKSKPAKLTGDEIVIATDSKALGLAGVRGGSDTEITADTTNIILECANFDMYSIRRTSMRHGQFTDAVTRFSKGQSPWQCDRVLAKTLEDVLVYAGGSVASPMLDSHERLSKAKAVEVSAKFINDRLGSDLKANDMKNLLENVEFKVVLNGDSLKVAAPFWRTDIEIPEDIVEEVGRLYGYDRLPAALPKRDLTPAQRNQALDQKRQIRESLVAAGANELLTYTFIHGELMDKVGQDRKLAFELNNAISPDLQYYRLSLTPSLLSKVEANIKAGRGTDQNQFAIFEMNPVHSKSEIAKGLPTEFDRLALVFAADEKTAKAKHEGAAFYQARTYLESVHRSLGRGLPELVPLKDAKIGNHKLLHQAIAPFDPERSALVQGPDGFTGVIGEYSASTTASLKLPVFCAGFELFMSALKPADVGERYQPLARFPASTQDITLKVTSTHNYQQVLKVVKSELGGAIQELGYEAKLECLKIYQPDDNHRNYTLRLAVSHPGRTLKTGEVNALMDQLADAAKEHLGATRI